MKNRYFVQKTLLTLCLAVLTGVLMLGANAALGTTPTYEPPGEVHVAPTFSALTVEGNVGVGIDDGIIALGHSVRTANRAGLHLHSNEDNVSEIMFGINNRVNNNVKWGISSRPGGPGDWEGDALHILEGPYNTGFRFWSRNMSFLPGGNVGIGVPAPTARLDVGGSALVSEDLVVGESLGVLGDSIVKGNMDVLGDSVVKGDSFVEGNMDVLGDSVVKGDSIVEGNIGVEGAMVVLESFLAQGNIWAGGSFRLNSGGGTEGLLRTCTSENRGEIKLEKFNWEGKEMDFLFACVKVEDDFYWARIKMELVVLEPPKFVMP